MADLIDRFSTINDMLSVSIVTDDLFGLGFQAGIDAGVRTIANRPAVDAVEVVRCRDCVSHGNCFTEDTFCIARIENPYCCGGKRREEK